MAEEGMVVGGAEGARGMAGFVGGAEVHEHDVRVASVSQRTAVSDSRGGPRSRSRAPRRRGYALAEGGAEGAAMDQVGPGHHRPPCAERAVR